MAQSTVSAPFPAVIDKHHAHLLIGPPNPIRTLLIEYLQKKWCQSNGCKSCQLCLEINARRHHALYWLQPDNGYKLEMIDELLTQTLFKLEKNELSFIIIDQADRLSLACANRMLKIVEEPPAGYRFIFISQRLEAVTQTIRSRCIITHLESQQVPITHPLAMAFLEEHLPTAEHFLKLLETCDIKEHDSNDIIDYLLGELLSIEKNDLYAQKDKKKILHRIHLLKKALMNSPMPGSNKVFWKNIYLSMVNLNHL